MTMDEKIKIRDFMNLPKDDIEAKKALMTMDKEDIIDRHLSRNKEEFNIRRKIILWFIYSLALNLILFGLLVLLTCSIIEYFI